VSEQIDQFFAPDGTLISIPVKPAKKIAVLKEIAKKLSPDTKYPEKELNAVIATYHPRFKVSFSSVKDSASLKTKSVT